jgi:hypothetical protein
MRTTRSRRSTTDVPRRHRRAALLRRTALVALLLLGPISRESAGLEEPKTMDETTKEAAESRRVDPFKVAIEEAHFIGIATILELGPPPSRWSDRAMSYQPVKLRVEQVLRGELAPGTELLVEYSVVKGSPSADRAVPKLNAAVFAVGEQRIVFLYKLGERWVSFDELYGALPMDQLQKVREHLGL